MTRPTLHAAVLPAFLFFASVASAFAPHRQDAPVAKPSAAPDLKDLANQVGDTRRALDGLPSQEGKLPSVVVNGVRISPEEVKRFALYMSGAASILAFQLDLATQEELERLKKDGVDTSSMMVTDKEIQDRVEETRRAFETVQPDITWDQALAMRQQTQASYEWTLRVQLQFEKVFLPTDTDKWPPMTIEAAGALAGPDPARRVDFIENIKKAIKQQQANPLLAMFKIQLIKKIADGVVLQDALDGLAADVALAHAGRAVKNADLIAKGMGFGGYPETVRATVFAAIREAVKQDLQKREIADFEAAKKDVAERRAKGEKVDDPKKPVYWLESGSDEFKQAFDEDRAKYPTAPFNHAAIVSMQQFPTMQIYRAFFQMNESYKRGSEKERSEQALLDHIDKDKLFFSNGAVDAQVIWFNYMGDATKGSYEEGFTAARLRAERALADLKKGADLAERARAEAKSQGKTPAEQEKAAVDAARGYTFEDILDRDSDYRDPKLQPNQQAPPMQTNRGRFGPQQRNPFSKSVHESKLASLIQGYSIGEDVFFRAPIGKVVGPMRGPMGYYIIRVVSRSPGAKQFDLATPSQRSLAEEDLVDHAFQEYVNRVVAKSKIEIVEG